MKIFPYNITKIKKNSSSTYYNIQSMFDLLHNKKITLKATHFVLVLNVCKTYQKKKKNRFKILWNNTFTAALVRFNQWWTQKLSCLLAYDLIQNSRINYWWMAKRFEFFEGKYVSDGHPKGTWGIWYKYSNVNFIQAIRLTI